MQLGSKNFRRYCTIFNKKKIRKNCLKIWKIIPPLNHLLKTLFTGKRNVNYESFYHFSCWPKPTKITSLVLQKWLLPKLPYSEKELNVRSFSIYIWKEKRMTLFYKYRLRLIHLHKILKLSLVQKNTQILWFICLISWIMLKAAYICLSKEG